LREKLHSKSLIFVYDENNRQGIELFGLGAPKHQVGLDWSIDYLVAAESAGLEVPE